MSDKVTDKKTAKKWSTKKKVILLSIISLLVCTVLILFLFSEELNLDRLRRWAKYLTVRNNEDYGSFAFDSHSSNCYESFGDGLAVASISGVSVYDEFGEEVFVVQQRFEVPQMQINKDLTMAYDVGGKHLVVLHKKKGEVLNLEETHPILDADLSEKGGLCVSSSASGYQSVLSVYNKDQDLIYRWLSSSTYFPLCTIAPNGRDLAAVAVGQNNGEYESKLCYFKTDSEKIVREVSLGNELIYVLDFIKADTLCALGEASVQFLTLKGEVVGRYYYKDKYLKDFDFGGDGFLVLATNMYRAGNRYSLCTVNDSGEQLAEVFVGQEVLDLSACGKYIAVLCPGKLTIYTKTLEVYSETTDVSGATAVVMRDDGTAIIIGAGHGELYIP